MQGKGEPVSEFVDEPWVANRLFTTDQVSGILQTEFVGDTLGSILEAFCTQSDLNVPYSVEIAVDPADAAAGVGVFIVSILSDTHPVEKFSVTRPHYVG